MGAGAEHLRAEGARRARPRRGAGRRPRRRCRARGRPRSRRGSSRPGPIPGAGPRSPRRPGPGPGRCAWSSASRSTWCSSACRAAAAMTPACRIPPPSTLRSRWALRISLGRARRGPSRPGRRAPSRSRSRPCRSAAPTRAAGTPEATTAFISRAPSRCMASPCAAGPGGDLGDVVDRVDPAAAAVVGVLQADEPGPDVVAVVGPDLAARGRPSASRPWSPVDRSAPSRPRAGRSRPLPRRRRATSASQSSSSPGPAWTPTAIWLAIVPDGTNSAASLPSSSAVRRSRALTVGSSP